MKSIKKVACILPVSGSKYRNHNSEDFIHMSGLVVIREYLKKHNFQVETFDYLRGEGKHTEILNCQLKKFAPEAVCICGMFCIEDIYDYIGANKDILMTSINVAVGTGALNYEKCLEKIEELDYVIPVNPEVVIEDIFKTEENIISKTELIGAAYRYEGRIIFKKRKPEDIDRIFEGINVSNYISFADNRMAYIWSSRGCWYKQCVYCNIGTASSLCDGTGWQIRDMKNVIYDIQELYSMGIRHFHFLDAEFIGPGIEGRKRVSEFAELLIEKNMGINFYIDVRVDCINMEAMSLLCKAGLKSVFIGVESAADHELDAIRKGYHAEIILNAINVIKKLGLSYRIGTLLAIPESTLDDIEQSLDFFFNNNIYQALNIVGVGSIFHELHLHLGTPIYEHYQEYIADKRLWKGEIECYYIEPDVKLFISYARKFQSYVIERYMQVKDGNLEENFQKKYLLSLRVVALTGLKELIKNIKNDNRDLDNVIITIFMKHDAFWLKRRGEISGLQEYFS